MTLGRMMDYPLTIGHLLARAEQYFGRTEIVSVFPDRSKRRSTYAQFVERSRRLASALQKLGVRPGDRVATFSWNHGAHLEAYFAVPAMGAVVHTLNIRLSPSEIGYIADHAGDVVVIVDQCLLPLFDKFRANIRSLRHVIVYPDKGEPVFEGMLDYEQLLAESSPEFVWPELGENDAAMLCYTSGTTGNPKGVLYSHRSTVLHALVAALPNLIGCSIDDIVLPVVPMFHAAAWGLPFIAVLSGAKIVFPGPHLDAASLLELMASEKVTVAGGVPTIWLGILAALDSEKGKYDLSSVRTMVIGGAAAPVSLIDGFQSRHGLVVTHAWGMTETNPLGTLARVKPHLRAANGAAPSTELAARATQGFAAPFFETRHIDADGHVLPWDGASMGELEVRGAWVASSYFGDEGQDRFTKDGWFKTGDVVTIDAEGYITITDREKDVIKSGGEWISSVSIENALMSHPAVLEAAVFAAHHPKWLERPVAAVVFKPGAKATEEELTQHLRAKDISKIALPDAYVFPTQIPRTSTGKFLKSKLRELYGKVLES
ncbi:3-methylmercaptopropionyl-CoA ligase (DmdB) [Labilithrix luteola]|uniref:3-methylmercaptopropionyl-CoA ligase (DmdB) n=1 Tax=Labilithrix luteola TaxID=1391654 RepID=A0A0K1PWG6_9BACT|nr:long-chain fatty acid--CoA ligase [Labilithrix luteola]AKU97711.1 3-methylmercaptopropionyl-CoA ligase (DmdB) [Labilithrix luteola]